MTIIQTLFVAVALMAAQAPVPQFSINAPVRVSAHPSEDYMPQVSPDGKVMAFVSSRAGAPNIWIKTIDSPEAPTPRRITTGVSGDKSPHFSSDGRKIVYVSLSSDAEGDLYLIDLPEKLANYSSFTPSPKQLTDISTADSEPVFSSDNSTIVFTSQDKQGGKQNIWRLNIATGERKQLTFNGGRSASLSKDGSRMVFVSGRDSPKGALYMLEITSGKISRLTSGQWIDSFPVFWENKNIIFVRYADDTDLDGQISIEDNPALYSMDISFPGMPPVPLTTSASYNLFPSVNNNDIYYSAKAGAEVDIFRISAEGLLPRLNYIYEEVARAKAIERFYPGNKALALLAWRVAWASHYGSGAHSSLAKILARQAQILKETGSYTEADKTLSQLIKLYPDSHRFAGLAKIERILIDAKVNNLPPDNILPKFWQVAKEYGHIRIVLAKVRIETGSAHLAAGRPAKALTIFRSVVKEFHDIKHAAAEAAYKRNGVYLLLQDRERQIETYLDVIRSYPRQSQWVEKSIEKVINLATVKGNIKESVTGLNEALEKYPDVPILQAAMMNAIAKLYHESSELLRAREVYQLTVSRFSDQKKAKSHALFQIAKIYVEEEEFAKAISVYRSIEQDTEAKREVYRKSRREFIYQSLRKGEYELEQGEVRIALKTFKSIIEYDARVVEAHRGLIRCRVAMGEAKRAVADYELASKINSDNDVYQYSLGLALTYLSPISLSKSEHAIKNALIKNEKNPWYHQTLGWIYEQKELKKGDGSYAQLALQEYGYALALTDVEKRQGRAADLRLNLGNVNYLLRNYADAKGHYIIREMSGERFSNPAMESLFHQRWGEIEFKLGEDEEAVRRFKKALTLLSDDDAPRKIEIYERMGLAYQSSEKWGEAAKSFRESLKLRRKTGALENETVILRNIANNLFFLGRSGADSDPEKLREALAFYHEGEKALERFKKREEKKKEGTALISIEIETGVKGVKSASKGFNKNDEKKLLFHHIGKIYGELGDNKKAVEYFEKKLELTPRVLPLIKNVPVLTEKAIVLNQLGYYLVGLDEPEKAIRRFIESLKLCMELENGAGLIMNTDNMARLAINQYNDLPEKLVLEMLELGSQALEIAEENEIARPDSLGTAFNHLGQLSHIIYKQKSLEPMPKDLKSQVIYIKGLAKFSVEAEKKYRQAQQSFAKSRSVATLRGSIGVSINLATLLNDQERNDRAIAVLIEAEGKAASFMLFDMMWKIKLLKFISDPVRFEKDLYLASTLLERTPFGIDISDNPSQALAMIRTIYHEIALRSQYDSEALVAIEKGRAVAIKFMLAGLVDAELKNEAVPGIEALTRLGRKQKLLTELFAGASGNPENIEENRKKYYGEIEIWKREYDNAIESLRSENPLLADIVAPQFFDVETVSGSLDDGEAAVALWSLAGAVKVFVVTQAGLQVMQIENEDAVPAALHGSFALKGVDRLYLVTDKPFSDPLVQKISSKRFSVATIPSFTSLYHFKEARSANDFKLTAFAKQSATMTLATTKYFEAKVYLDEQAEKAVNSGSYKTSGVMLFENAPVLDSSNLVQAKFAINSKGKVPRWLSFSKIVDFDSNRSLLITPPVKSGNGREQESGLLTLSLLSGFSSWVVTPEDEKRRDEFIGSFLEKAREDSILSALKAAPGGRLAGSFGFSKEEKSTYASRSYVNRIKAGVAAFNERDWNRAADMLEQALVYTSVANVKKYNETLLDRLAEIEFSRGKYKSALKYQNRLNAIFRSTKQRVKLADSLLLTGVIQAKLKRFSQAVETMNVALGIYRKKGLMEKVASTLSRIGVAEESFTRYGKALAAYRAALDIKIEDNADSGAARELLRIGRIYHLRLNQYSKARETYRDAFNIFYANQNMAMAVRSLIDAGAVEEDAGALDEAELLFHQALDMALDNKNDKAAALARFHIANVSWYRGAYEPAFTWIRRSIKTAESIGADDVKIMSLNTLGLIYITLNDYRKAILNLEKSLKLARTTGAKLDEASALNNIGLAYRKMGKLTKSVDYFRKARAIDEELKSEWGIAYDARNISISLTKLGKIAEAKRMAEEAVSLTEKIGDRVNGAKAWLQLAETMAADNDWDKALPTYRKAGQNAMAAGVREALWRAYWGAGRALMAKGESKSAVVEYMKAVDLVEKLRGAIKADELKQGFLEDKQELYEELILLLLDRGATNLAFEYAERARARSFIDLLGRTKIKLKDERSQREYEAVLELKRKLSEIDKTVALNPADRNLAARQRTLADKLERTIKRLLIQQPDIVPFVSVEPVNAQRILSAINEGVVLLEYVVTAKEVVIFIVGSGKIKAVRAPVSRKELTELVLGYRGLINDSAPLGEKGRMLGEILIDPVEVELGKYKVVAIAPHSVLHYLSFASIQLVEGYLIDKKSLFYVPSASVYERSVKKRKRSKMIENTNVLALGNPDLGNYNTDLPLSELEALSIKRVFSKVDVFIRGKATESLLTNAGERYQVIHIASHGQFDPAAPLKSSLYLAADVKNDGALQASEVFALNLPVDLVTLSACQTGLGKVSKGDEVVGLSRAFMYSGASSILSTLWRVDDMASAVLVKHFYRNLPLGGKADALRKAQLTVKRRFPHPAFWAGFTLAGDY